jgi:hypothetical protein
MIHDVRSSTQSSGRVTKGVSALNTFRDRGREESAQGQVVDMTERRAENGNQFSFPVVEFILPDETVQTVQLAQGSWPPAYEVGDVATKFNFKAKRLLFVIY